MFSRIFGSTSANGDRDEQERLDALPLQQSSDQAQPSLTRSDPSSTPTYSPVGSVRSSPRKKANRSGTNTPRNKDWVPLFVSPNSSSSRDRFGDENEEQDEGNSPLITTTVLPPTPKRVTYAGSAASPSSPRGAINGIDARRSSLAESFASNPSDSDLAPPPIPAWPSSLDQGLSPAVDGFGLGLSPSLEQRRTYSYQNTGGAASNLNANGHHLRRRSSSTNLKNEGLEAFEMKNGMHPSDAVSSSIAPYSSTLAAPSGSSLLPGSSSKLSKKRNSSLDALMSSGKARAQGFSYFKNNISPRPYRAAFRLTVLLFCISMSVYLARQIVHIIFPPPPRNPDTFSPAGSSWLNSIPRAKALFDTFETVPYPIKTHPRTPRDEEYRSLTFADYLSTRLGSHFSYPTPSSSRSRPSQLWLTTATVESVNLTAIHLEGFVNDLNLKGDDATMEDLRSDSADRFAKRALVVLCRDQGCLAYCRKRPGMFCWGGMIPEGRDERKVKLRAKVETLESGRRLFFVDSDVFFKTDPIPHMGLLSDYDMQITDTWKTGAMQTGFIFLNPTQNTISLFRRLLELSRGPDAEDHIWRTTNLLLDPQGHHRDHGHVAPPHNPGEDENLFSEQNRGSDDAVESLYGQTEFESGWGGGIDVKVLDRKRFRTSTGRLARMDWEREINNLAVYFHCNCCGDLASESYMAGSLGYHTPSVVYPLLEDDLLRQSRAGAAGSRRPSSSSSSETVPSFPLVLRATSLKGNETTLRFVMGVLLQAAHDSGRSFVPPLKGTILKKPTYSTSSPVQELDRYIWRIFPTSDWAKHPSHVAGGQVHLTEPNYVVHAIEHLRATCSETEAGLEAISELSSVLWLDFQQMRSYEEMIRVLTRPYFSTTRVVNVENVETVEGKEYWELRDEFKELDMCEIDETHEGHGGEEGSCEVICSIKPRTIN